MHSINAVALAAFLSLCCSVAAQTPTQCYTNKYTPLPKASVPLLNCDTKGFLAQPDELESVPSADLDSCVAACKAHTQPRACVSFAYSAGNATCQLFGKRLLDMDYRRRRTDKGTRFFNARCYACEQCPNDEAVRNGGMEEYSESSNVGTAYWSTTVDDSYNRFYNGGGNYTLFAQHVGFKNVLQQLACVDPGVAYVFSAYIHVDGVGNNYNVSLDGVPFFGCSNPEGCSGSRTVTPLSATPVLQIDYEIVEDGSFSNIDAVSLLRQGQSS